MKQNIVEVIVYLLEMTAIRSFESDDRLCDRDLVQQRLEDAGFSDEVVASTFDWLKELIEQKSWCASVGDDDNASRTFRVFSQEEQARISMEVRSFILSLEYSGILDTRMREVVISQLIELDQDVVELIDAKWVILLVMMSGSNDNIKNMRSYLLATMALEV